jgi:DNA-directed RNA polymerase subunit RPC12/RpoP
VLSVAHVNCSACETRVLVLPEVVASSLDVRQDALRDVLGGLDDRSGARFTVADQDGGFVCPQCSMPGCAPEIRA